MLTLKRLLVLSVLSLSSINFIFSASVHGSPLIGKDWLVQKGNHCHLGFKPVKKTQVKKIKSKVCRRIINYWGIVRLDGDNVIVGQGYGCRFEKRKNLVGESLCQPQKESYSTLDSDTKNILEVHQNEKHQHAGAAIAPNHVHFVDDNLQKGNYFFRGSNPVSEKSFQYTNLKRALEDAAIAEGIVLPQNYYLIDISLLNSIFSPSEKIEEAFFKENPDLGEVINHPVYGAATNPNDFPEAIRKKLVDKFSTDHVSALIEKINRLMKIQTIKPVVIFTHCEAGKDRTGEVVAAYRMYFEKYLYKDALAEAERIAQRPISKYSKYGIMWFGYWLRYKKGIDVGPIE